MPKSKLQKKKDNPKSGYWLKKADALWGSIIHEIYPTCAVGHECSGQVEAHHLISRANRGTRHKITNGIGLCTKHHKFSPKLSPHGAPLAFAEWLVGADNEKWVWCSDNKYKVLRYDYRQSHEELKKWCELNAPHLIDYK